MKSRLPISVLKKSCEVLIIKRFEPAKIKAGSINKTLPALFKLYTNLTTKD